jgi:hypothetical protein
MMNVIINSSKLNHLELTQNSEMIKRVARLKILDTYGHLSDHIRAVSYLSGKLNQMTGE